MTPLYILLASLAVGLALALWRQIVVAQDERRTRLAECLRLNNRIADDAVELLRLRSLVGALQGTVKTTGFVDTLNVDAVVQSGAVEKLSKMTFGPERGR